MNNADWTSAYGEPLLDLVGRFVHYIPMLVAAAGLVVIGWVVARVLRALAVRLARALDQMILRLAGRPVAQPHATPAWGGILGSIVFWVVILFFLALATNLLGLDAFSAWLNRVVSYLPTLFVGVLVVLAGVLVSALARDLVIAMAPLDENQRVLLGRIAQTMILVIAVVIGADQIGINVTFLIILAAIVLGTLLGGVALAVSFGARTFVANLISGHTVRQTYKLGQMVRIMGFEGRILDITPTVVVLETADGRVNLPAKVFSEEPAEVLMDRTPHG